jgi:hypothetical protein
MPEKLDGTEYVSEMLAESEAGGMVYGLGNIRLEMTILKTHDSQVARSWSGRTFTQIAADYSTCGAHAGGYVAQIGPAHSNRICGGCRVPTR